MHLNEREEREETDEEFLARLAARRAKKKAAKAAAEEAAKPRLVLPVSQETAETVRLRPESVRLSTIRDDGVPVLERVRPREIVQPLEVDVNGRIARARVVDCATGEAGIVDYRNGYRQGPGVVSDYNPLDGLRRSVDD